MEIYELVIEMKLLERRLTLYEEKYGVLSEDFYQTYQAGDTVLDPFAGFSTTLMVAERVGRIPFGIEINPEKAKYVRGKLSQPENLIRGDVRFLAGMSLPVIDFSMTCIEVMLQAISGKEVLPFYHGQIQAIGIRR